MAVGEERRRSRAVCRAKKKKLAEKKKKAGHREREVPPRKKTKRKKNKRLAMIFGKKGNVGKRKGRRPCPPRDGKRYGALPSRQKKKEKTIREKRNNKQSRTSGPQGEREELP